MSIYKKLQSARAAFHALPLKKTGRNEFSGFDYFELSDFLPKAIECLSKEGLVPVVSFGVDVATLTLHDDTGNTVVVTSPMSKASLKACHEVQNLGAVQTYIRRYLYAALMELVENDVLDATVGKDQPSQPSTQPTPNQAPAAQGNPKPSRPVQPQQKQQQPQPQGDDEWPPFQGNWRDVKINNPKSKNYGAYLGQLELSTLEFYAKGPVRCKPDGTPWPDSLEITTACRTAVAELTGQTSAPPVDDGDEVPY